MGGLFIEEVLAHCMAGLDRAHDLAEGLRRSVYLRADADRLGGICHLRQPIATNDEYLGGRAHHFIEAGFRNPSRHSVVSRFSPGAIACNGRAWREDLKTLHR